MTEPGVIWSTMAVDTMTGAFAPCTWAVVMTTSLPATVFESSSCCLRSVSSDICWA